MTTIKATCPTCGEVSLTPDDIDLRVDSHNVEESTYGFECPGCDEPVRKPADERIVRLLVSGGVEVRDIDRRVKLSERFDGPRLNHDDLLDFHTMLQADDWFDEVARLEQR